MRRAFGVALVLALFVGALGLARRLDRVRLRSALRERRPAEAPARRASELVEGESITLAGMLEAEGEPAASLRAAYSKPEGDAFRMSETTCG